ncbi:MAG: transporter substrate-binding domain-containing protein, partial [Bacteriovoracaceae bacterium]|nr:transporter substrate-binding domain-containing protein [Bacteriovoracaceae bacterium]
KIGPNKRFELDVIKEVFSIVGVTPKFHYFQMKDLFSSLASGKVEIAMTLKSSMGGGIYYSDTYIHYQNVAATLADKKIDIERIAALANHSVGAFQNAHKFLGREYGQAVRNHMKYKEYKEQDRQVTDLFRGEIDVFIGDINIFNYYKKMVAQKIDVGAEVEISEIFPKTNYQVGFRNKNLRDKFNTALDFIKSNGTYKRKRDQYSKVLKGNPKSSN